MTIQPHDTHKDETHKAAQHEREAQAERDRAAYRAAQHEREAQAERDRAAQHGTQHGPHAGDHRDVVQAQTVTPPNLLPSVGPADPLATSIIFDLNRIDSHLRAGNPSLTLGFALLQLIQQQFGTSIGQPDTMQPPA